MSRPTPTPAPEPVRASAPVIPDVPVENLKPGEFEYVMQQDGTIQKRKKTTDHNVIIAGTGYNPSRTSHSFSIRASSPYLNVPEIYPFTNLDAVVLTHAHLDHSAFIPLLFRYGYDGPVYTTPATP